MPLAPDRPGVRTRRQDRHIERVRRAVRGADAERNSAMARALAEIETAFDETAIVNDFKIRVEQVLRLGPHHAAVRARFGARAAMLFDRDLDAATAMVERWWRDERKAFQIASAFGCATRLSLDVLREIHLILRLMRFKRMQAEYEASLAALCEMPMAAAAE